MKEGYPPLAPDANRPASARLRAAVAGASKFDRNADPTTVTDVTTVSALAAGMLINVPISGLVTRLSPQECERFIVSAESRRTGADDDNPRHQPGGLLGDAGKSV
jgi:hypothetical protein